MRNVPHPGLYISTERLYFVRLFVTSVDIGFLLVQKFDTLKASSTHIISIKMYHLEESATTHHLQLSHALQQLCVSQPDLCILTKEGHAVHTRRFILGFHSQFVKDIFSTVPHTDLAFMSLPISSSTLSCLMRILSHGATESDDRFDPLEVIAAAEVLGIDMEDVQVGIKKGNKKKFEKENDTATPIKVESKSENVLEQENVESFVSLEINTETFVMDGIQLKDETLNDRSLHEEQKFECEICSKKFKTKEKLGKHERYHMKIEKEKVDNPEKISSCEVCTKEFMSNSTLKTHMITHTDEKPYKCETCDKRFNQKVTCERHQVLHTGIKAFKCEFCEKRFRRRDTLKEHTSRKHNGC